RAPAGVAASQRKNPREEACPRGGLSLPVRPDSSGALTRRVRRACQLRLQARRLVRVDQTLARRPIEQRLRIEKRALGSVALRLTGLLDRGAEPGAGGLVPLLADLVGPHPLLSGLDVRQNGPPVKRTK